MDDGISFRAYKQTDVESVKIFADQWIGKDYFSLQDLDLIYSLSRECSFLALCKEELVGIRLSFAPGSWSSEMASGLSIDKWGIAVQDMAYFKSLFIHQDFQGRGLGKTISDLSIEALKLKGAKGVLCHSWLESPHDSSRRYLKKLGFREVAQHQNFWNAIDYQCVRCSPAKCTCTAVEMILNLEIQK